MRPVFPLKDDNPTRRVPFVTIALIAVNIGVYFLVQPSGIPDRTAPAQQQQIDDLEFNLEYAAIPCEVTRGRPLTVEEIRDTFLSGDDTACRSDPDTPAPFADKQVWLAVLYSMFLHGGLLHLGGNMLFLWIFGNNIEDHLGHIRYVLFYLASGLAATVAHVAVQPDSTVPIVGASGAIAGIMGAYMVWFPNAPILTVFIFFFVLFRRIAAKWWLAGWFVLQFFTAPSSGVAWVAHVGGFVFGAAIGLLVRASRGARKALWTGDHVGPTAPDPFGGHDRRPWS